MVCGCVLERTGGNKNLISPIDREATRTRGGIYTSLADHCFKDSNWFLFAGGELVTHREFLLFGKSEGTSEHVSKS